MIPLSCIHAKRKVNHLVTHTQAPIIIFDDADLISAVNGVAFASFVASGQTCVSGTRILVQDGVYKPFMAAFLAKVESIRQRMGDRAFSQ